jgi:nucleoid-associated protein YgaU
LQEARPSTHTSGSFAAEVLAQGKALAFRGLGGVINMNLRDKYNHAIQVAKGYRMEGSAQERDGKLYFNGLVNNQDEVNKIWDAIKSVPDWRNDIVAEIKIDPNAKQAQPTTYTVKSGDTLSKIAKEYLGDANAYMKIFNANKDQLTDPDKIKPGQVLKIPTAA